jgi:hypothetical protein
MTTSTAGSSFAALSAWTSVFVLASKPSVCESCFDNEGWRQGEHYSF